MQCNVSAKRNTVCKNFLSSYTYKRLKDKTIILLTFLFFPTILVEKMCFFSLTN